MDYFDYINSIQPSADVKSKIEASAKEEFNKSNRRRLRQRKAFISIAACFVIFIAAFTTVSQIGAAKFNNSTTEMPNAKEYYILDGSHQLKCIQTITVDGKIYQLTYAYSENKLPKSLDGNVVIRRVDLGDKICILDKMSANGSDYYNVIIYKYRTTDEHEYIVAETENDYFLFARYIGEE